MTRGRERCATRHATVRVRGVTYDWITNKTPRVDCRFLPGHLHSSIDHQEISIFPPFSPNYMFKKTFVHQLSTIHSIPWNQVSKLEIVIFAWNHRYNPFHSPLYHKAILQKINNNAFFIITMKTMPIMILIMVVPECSSDFTFWDYFRLCLFTDITVSWHRLISNIAIACLDLLLCVLLLFNKSFRVYLESLFAALVYKKIKW